MKTSPELAAKVCLMAVRLLRQHEESVVNLLAEIVDHASSLESQDAIEILRMLSLNKELYQCWADVTSALVDVLYQEYRNAEE